MKKIHGIVHINLIELDKKHKLTLKMLSKRGFLGNWINTSYVPELQIFKNDIEDSNYILVTVEYELIDVNSSFGEIDLHSKEGEELMTSFIPAMDIVSKIYYRNLEGLDATDDYTITRE